MAENVSAEDVVIVDPEFTFIFTVNLDGKINMQSILSDNKSTLEALIKKKYELESFKDYFATKALFFERLLSSDCKEGGNVGCGKCDVCKIRYINITETKLSYFIDDDFLQKAVLGCWELDENIKDKNSSLYPPDHGQSIFKKYETICTMERMKKDIGKDAMECIITVENEKIFFPELPKWVRISDSKLTIKLFSNGSLSILVRLKFAKTKTEITPSNLIALIQFPNMVVSQYTTRAAIPEGEPITGFLNYLAYDIANNAFNTFFQCMRKNKDKKKKTIGDYIEIERIVKKGKDKQRYTISQRYEDNKYTLNINGNKYIQSWPYVGVMFDLPKILTPLGEDENNDNYKRLSKLLASVATQTNSFVSNFAHPSAYLKENSITRGSQDAIIIERRGFVACGIRREKGDQGKDRKNFLDNPFATLVFCIEAIMSNVKSVNAFNKELEEYVSLAVSNMLRKNSHFSHSLTIRKLYRLISKARSLSPCEDYSSNLIPNLRSQIAIEGSLRMQKFALNILVASVQHRLENYGHFLRATYESLTAEIRVITALIGVLFAIFWTFHKTIGCWGSLVVHKFCEIAVGLGSLVIHKLPAIYHYLFQ